MKFIDAIQLLKNGKKIVSLNHPFPHYYYLNKDKEVCCFNKYEQKSSVLSFIENRDVYAEYVGDKVKEGMIFKNPFEQFVIVKTGEVTMRLVDVFTWISKSNVNVYNMSVDDVEQMTKAKLQ